MYPMQWVEVDNNAHQRRNTDNTTVPPRCKSRMVGCGNFATEGVRIDSPASDVDSHRIVCCWCAQDHVSIHACDFGLEIDSLLLYRVPAGGMPEEGISGGAIWASCVPIDGTKDAGRGLWFRVKETCQASGFSLNQILPTPCTLRRDGSEIIAVVAANVDDLLYGYFPEGEEGMNSKLRQLLVGQERMWYFQILWQ